MGTTPIPGSLLGFTSSGRPVFHVKGGNGEGESAAGEPQVVVGASNNLNQTSHEVDVSSRSQAEEFRFTAKDIEQARDQEKSKVYSRLERLQETVQTLQQEREERLAAEAASLAEAEEAQRRAAEAEMDVRSLLEQKEREFNERLAALEAERQRERDALQQQRREVEIARYREQAIAANADNILPELVDLVVHGPSEAEIDASIAGLVTRSNSILEAASEQVSLAKRDQRTVSPTGAAPAGPLDNSTAQKTVTAADIAAMDMDEYAKYRASIGVGGNLSRGLFS